MWWLSKTNNPKSDIKKVLVPYSSRMQHLIEHPQDFVKEEGNIRPSGHVMGMKSWTKNNGVQFHQIYCKLATARVKVNILDTAKPLE